ncbi:MAG: hypothetical protein KBF82_02630 [Chitinophagaceae bacterium]|nr:hypothetical protein [Chitinophagaceae bacterium]
MANQNDKKKKNEEVQADNGLKPDSKTLHKTDPQENMEGPISSIVQNVKENVEEDDTTKEEADKKKEENM